jgi:hypothetical protein
MAEANKPFRLRARRSSQIGILVVPPMGTAAASLWVETWFVGHISLGTTLFAGVMLVIAAVGLIYAMRPPTLVADAEGIRWSRGARQRIYRWSDIEEIGVARQKGLEGWDARLPRVLTGTSSGEIRRWRAPQIGLNLVATQSPYSDPGTRAFHKGFTGYEVNLANDFDAPIEAIVDQLRSRWLQHR